jgi:transposase-like protein
MADNSVTCPFCSAHAAELVSLFGSQLLLSQYRCSACGSYFEGLREDRGDTEPVPARGGTADGGRAEL